MPQHPLSILTHKYSHTLISYLHKCFTSAGLNPVLVAVQPAVVARGKLGDQFCHFSASFEGFSMGERAFFLWNSASNPNVSFLTLALSHSFSLSLSLCKDSVYTYVYIHTYMYSMQHDIVFLFDSIFPYQCNQCFFDCQWSFLLFCRRLGQTCPRCSRENFDSSDACHVDVVCWF